MRILKVAGVSALGKDGPVGAADKIVGELGVDSEEIVVDNSNVEESGKIIYERAKDVFGGESFGKAKSFANAGISKRCVFVGGDHST